MIIIVVDWSDKVPASVDLQSLEEKTMTIDTPLNRAGEMQIFLDREE